MDRPQIAAIVAAVAVLGASLLWYTDRSPAPGPVPVAVVSDAAPETITVHVSGAVHRPGVVEVAAGSRVADAVAAAGGASTSARLVAINLAALLSDGQQVVVPDAEGADQTPASGDGRIAVNRAAAADLEALPGVGPVLAGRIVAHRDQFGPFESVEDLLDVPGIGEAKLAPLRDLIVIP